MSQYNDRPQSSKWEKRLTHSVYEYPRDARNYFAKLGFAIQGFLFLIFSLIACSIWIHTFFVGKHDLFSYMILAFLVFLLKGLFEVWKDLKASSQMNDIEALWYMENEPVAPKALDRFYARTWFNHFPHWAERIDPLTGNVDPKRAPSDKSWWAVKQDIREMMRESCRGKSSLPKSKGKHSL